MQLLEKTFKLKEHKTTVLTEVVGGNQQKAIVAPISPDSKITSPARSVGASRAPRAWVDSRSGQRVENMLTTFLQ